jgi:hypothetical protein
LKAYDFHFFIIPFLLKQKVSERETLRKEVE